MSGSEFEVSEARDGDRVVLAVSGEIDLGTVGELRDALVRAGESGAPEVLVDLSDVDFMDSTGLSALVIAHRSMGADARWLVIICPPGPARRALEVSGLDGVLRLDRAR